MEVNISEPEIKISEPEINISEAEINISEPEINIHEPENLEATKSIVVRGCRNKQSDYGTAKKMRLDETKGGKARGKYALRETGAVLYSTAYL